MEAGFFVPGPLPGLNELIDAAKTRGNRARNFNGYANMKKQVGESVYWDLINMKMRRFERVWLHFTWYENNHLRDPDNISAGGRKIILDAMVKAGVIADDSQKHVVGFTEEFLVRKGAAGVHVVLMEATE